MRWLNVFRQTFDIFVFWRNRQFGGRCSRPTATLVLKGGFWWFEWEINRNFFFLSVINPNDWPRRFFDQHRFVSLCLDRVLVRKQINSQLFILLLPPFIFTFFFQLRPIFASKLRTFSRSAVRIGRKSISSLIWMQTKWLLANIARHYWF